jgi:two-component sensor histidine kinase
MASELTGRLTALGRAHDLVRPLPGHQGQAALLGDLLAILLSPYEDTGAFSGRIRVAVPRMGVGESAATTLALGINELATNSLNMERSRPRRERSTFRAALTRMMS